MKNCPDRRKSAKSRRKRIEALRKEAERLGAVSTYVSDDCPPEIQEQFWERVIAFETAPQRPLFELLIESGLELPAPETLSAQEVSKKLWEVIRALAKRRVYLLNTDHLSDDELYAELWSDTLRVGRVLLEDGSNCRIDMVGSGSDEDIELYLKYYADKRWREEWKEWWPEQRIPAHVDPPYDRDRHLPCPETGCVRHGTSDLIS